ncbi:MAG: DUF29 domain-containing protein [Chloroherpetonaceae bacterium]|nr:DUF29 domain-containing protein [Chloroherpetonaceae bacterium]MCS7210244.1 DUF29 domain-containing protein [Chloroherpetonaceae bacterium]MDW8020775.1 DUF29 domain-containing protein [Chloroherpetonaceae bacterium]MDW8465299.1 DUF29 domain-containing protein [Chloroherpetonaceae bacterium]
MKNWTELATESHLLHAEAIREALESGDVEQAKLGLQALIDAMSRSEKRAMKSFLTLLMAHVIKWKAQPEKRSVSWAKTILSARREIKRIQEDAPSLNRAYLESIWNECFQDAKEEAELEMQKKCNLESLSWQEVFQDEYNLTSRA